MALREFTDEQDQSWQASVVERDDHDYKGRCHLVMTSAATGERVELTDVRWNNPATAQRTLDTMSLIELRRRLRSARGRGVVARS
jgi:hypothetical protein